MKPGTDVGVSAWARTGLSPHTGKPGGKREIGAAAWRVRGRRGVGSASGEKRVSASAGGETQQHEIKKTTHYNRKRPDLTGAITERSVKKNRKQGSNGGGWCHGAERGARGERTTVRPVEGERGEAKTHQVQRACCTRLNTLSCTSSSSS